MAWLVALAVIVLLAFFLMKVGKGNPTVRQRTRSAQGRAKILSEIEKDDLSAEIRTLAHDQYRIGSAMAKESGEEDAFAHQVGVLCAVRAVVAQGERLDSRGEKQLQMETAPFNNISPDNGRLAVVEYLVFKFFPDRADEAAFSPALVSFKHYLFTEAEKQSDQDGFIFNMLYCEKYDWQRYIVKMLASEISVSSPAK